MAKQQECRPNAAWQQQAAGGTLAEDPADPTAEVSIHRVPNGGARLSLAIVPDDQPICPACRRPLARPVGVVWFPVRHRSAGITVHPVVLHEGCRYQAFALGLGDLDIPNIPIAGTEAGA